MSEGTIRPKGDVQPPEGVWIVALRISIALGVAGLLLGSLMLNEIINGKFVARTVWGVLAMAMGFITPLVPLVLGMNRQRFLTLRRNSQWLLTTMIPSAFVAALVLLLVGARNSSRAIIGFTPTLALRFDGFDENGVPQLNFRVHGALVSGGSADAQEVRAGEPLTMDQRTHRFRFDAHAGHMGSRDGGPWLRDIGLIVELSGSVPPPKDDRVQMTLEVYAKTTIKFRVDGLAKVRISRDGEDVLEPVEFEPGQYTIVVEGHPTSVLGT